MFHTSLTTQEYDYWYFDITIANLAVEWLKLLLCEMKFLTGFWACQVLLSLMIGPVGFPLHSSLFTIQS